MMTRANTTKSGVRKGEHIGAGAAEAKTVKPQAERLDDVGAGRLVLLAVEVSTAWKWDQRERAYVRERA